MATVFSTSHFLLFAMLVFGFLFNASVQVSPSVQNENSVSVVIKTLWVKAPLKPVGESPSFNTWPIRPPFWVKNTTRLSRHKKTQWVKAPLNPMWVKNPQTTPNNFNKIPNLGPQGHFNHQQETDAIYYHNENPPRTNTWTVHD